MHKMFMIKIILFSQERGIFILYEIKNIMIQEIFFTQER